MNTLAKQQRLAVPTRRDATNRIAAPSSRRPE